MLISNVNIKQYTKIHNNLNKKLSINLKHTTYEENWAYYSDIKSNSDTHFDLKPPSTSTHLHRSPPLSPQNC